MTGCRKEQLSPGRLHAKTLLEFMLEAESRRSLTHPAVLNLALAVLATKVPVDVLVRENDAPPPPDNLTEVLDSLYASAELAVFFARGGPA